MRQLGDTEIDDDTEEEEQTLDLQVFRRAIPALVEKDTEVANEAEKSDGPPEGMDANGSELLLRKEQKQDSINVIDQLRIKSKEKSCLKILLCRLWTFIVVRKPK